MNGSLYEDVVIVFNSQNRLLSLQIGKELGDVPAVDALDALLPIEDNKTVLL